MLAGSWKSSSKSRVNFTVYTKGRGPIMNETARENLLRFLRSWLTAEQFTEAEDLVDLSTDEAYSNGSFDTSFYSPGTGDPTD